MSAYSSIHNKHSYESISPGKHSSSAKASPQVAFDSYDSSIDDIRSTDCKKEGALQSAMEASFAGVQSKLLRNESRRKSFRGVAKMNQLKTEAIEYRNQYNNEYGMAKFHSNAAKQASSLSKFPS